VAAQGKCAGPVANAASFANRADTRAGGGGRIIAHQSAVLLLDDLLAVVREFLNLNASPSVLDRCLRRHGGTLRDLWEKAPTDCCVSSCQKALTSCLLSLPPVMQEVFPL